MNAVLKPPRFANAEEYLAWEELQPEKHEYVDGEVYAMVDARLTHNTIALNACMWLRQAFKGAPCRVYGLEAKLQTEASGAFFYPDVMASCDTRDHPGVEDRFISHPWLVVEVLSDSTAAYDRGRKFEAYRSIPTLTHHLLVEQTRAHADLFFKNEQGQWVLQPLAEADVMQIDRLGQPWPVASLFEDVDFSVPPSPESAPAAGAAAQLPIAPP